MICQNVKKFAVVNSVKGFAEVNKSENGDFCIFHGFQTSISDFKESRGSAVGSSASIGGRRIYGISFNIGNNLIGHNFFKNFGETG